MKLQFKTNINCEGCVAAVAPYLNKEKDIQSWKADIDSDQKILSIETQKLSGDDIVALLKTAGYTAEKM